MIPTAYRDALGAGHSYPVGAEVLSTSLGDLPATVGLKLWFWRQSEPLGFDHPGWRRRHKGYPPSLREYAAVLAVHLRRDRQDLEADVVCVYSVTSETRAAVRQALKSPGLPLVRHWLEVPRPLTWRHQRRYLQVGVNPTVTRLCLVESDDERVTNHQVVDLPTVQQASQPLQPSGSSRR